jgi:hypothetical protein
MSGIPYSETLFSGTVTASGDTQSTPIITKWVREAVFFLDITAISGTGATLAIDLQTYNTLADKWHKLAEWEDKTATGTDEGFVTILGEKVAVDYTVSGTNPSITFSVTAHFKEF